MSNATSTAEASFQARLVTKPEGGAESARPLAEGDNLTIGSAEDCEVRVLGPDVAAMHCMLNVRGGKVWLRDCYSPAGTLVNGRRIMEAQIKPDDEVRVGSCRLSILETHAPVAAVDPSAASSALAPQAIGELPQATGPADESRASSPGSLAAGPGATVGLSNRAHDTAGRAGSGTRAPDALRDDSSEQRERTEVADAARLREELDAALSEIVDLRSQLKNARSQDVRRSAPAANDPFQEEMIDLLRDEVTQLQSELAERDARLAELEQAAVPSAPSVRPAESASEGLLDRLEQLLDELDRKDEHIRSLEDLLAMADEATKAEHEERRQLEAWVTDIEARIGARESEWEATVANLRRQLDERTEERDRAERDLETAASPGNVGAGGLHERLVENLREQVAELERRLAEADQRSRDLENRLQRAPEGGSAAYVQAKVDEQLRAERLELARERAAVARAKAEFERSRGCSGEAGGQAGSPENWSAGLDSSQRIRALREHLKDIHDEEAKQRHVRGLSGRIASLWKRLETRDDGD